MNRLQKKCIIFSVSLHVMLIGILLFGSAFLASQPKAESPPVLTAFDPKMINDLLTKGGNPNVQVAPPSTPPSTPQQNKQADVPKPVEPPKQQREKQDKVESPDPPVHKEKFSDELPKRRVKDTLSADDLKPIKSHPTKPAKRREQSDLSAKEYADNSRVAKNFQSAVQNLSKELSTSTAVELPGLGGGGPLSAAYRDIVASTYNAAWSSPADISDENAQGCIKVTISRSGRVISGHISKPSHDEAMNRSLQNLLDTVTFVAPFPEGSSDSERTFEIVLTMRAKH